MNYQIFVKSLFQNLGFKKTYKGTKYIAYILELLSEDESSIEMVTKRLYIGTAEKYKTYWTCVEKNIRKVISMLWEIPENKTFFEKLLGSENLEKKPTNKDFIFALYQYTKAECSYSETTTDYYIDCICPKTGKICNTCVELTKHIVEKYEKERLK
ncbi:MAG: hypothetical protein IKJ01_08145 [Lachnospiraceae bacterium]|nr:hypothetical protein [Lachnospiraceae bacterium]